MLADTTSRGLWGCDFGNRTCFDVELKAAPCLLEPPATRSFSTEDTPASHRQSSIPSAAQGSLSTDSRPALPGVYGVHVQPAQRLPDEPAEPHENGHARCIDSPAECGDRYLVNARMSPKAGEQRAKQAWSHSMPRRTNLKISSEYP